MGCSELLGGARGAGGDGGEGTTVGGIEADGELGGDAAGAEDAEGEFGWGVHGGGPCAGRARCPRYGAEGRAECPRYGVGVKG